MLDDLKLIHERDTQDALGRAAKQAEQLTYEIPLSGTPHFRRVSNIVFVGMGASALPALVARSWPLSVPMEIVQNYDIPSYVNEHTLFIAASYSGNTEETLSALHEAAALHAQVVVIASGGQLLQLAVEHGYFYAKLPTLLGQARFAVFAALRALLLVLEAANCMEQDPWPALVRAQKHLRKETADWTAEMVTKRNLAKTLALELIGKSIVIYSGPKLAPAARKWKISFNENAKHIAWTGVYPEFNHSELIGWTKQPVEKPYAVVELRSGLERAQVTRRFALTERLLSGLRPSPLTVEAKGSTIFEQLAWTCMLGEFVSMYVAVLGNINPTPVAIVDKLKRAME